MSSNRLANETSPYLLQHQHNPVDWYPWGEEALDRAVEENKPILLSIGYSACHWCHVMERESFENVEIARLMNENFVCIKVDREERPDLDQIYQNVAQALTRGGGWPLTVFLTPARRPFFGGTYFPPEDQMGRAGFKRVLTALSKAYQTDPLGVAQNAMKLTAYIEAAETQAGEAEGERSESAPDWLTLENAADVLLSHTDPLNGGIGDAPKFPNVMALTALWRVGTLRANEAARQAVLLALRKMASGGIYDQIGGGFSRYSVDATWSVPHFEKMLYDNGLLLRLYSEVLLSENVPDGEKPNWKLSGEDRELFESVVRGSTRYLLREMVSLEGGFYAAQDADSEGEEGKFFVWDFHDLEKVLPGEANDKDRRIFGLRFGVSEAGNFEHGKTVLFLAQAPGEISRELGISAEEVQQSLARSVRAVFEARTRRVPPATDTKVLASWNGLAISGLCWAYQVLKGSHPDEADHALRAAVHAFDLVSEKMVSGQDGKLSATFQGGRPKLNGYLDDYAFMAQAALDLARASEEPGTLTKALRMATLWTKRIIRRFKDEKRGGYFFTSDDHEDLLHRPKSVFDQAIPSGIAVALQAMTALAEMEDSVVSDFSKEAGTELRTLFSSIEKSPFGCAELMNAVILSLVGPVVVSGPGSSQAFVSPLIFRKQGDGRDSPLLVCHRRACDSPYTDTKQLTKAALAKIGYVG